MLHLASVLLQTTTGTTPAKSNDNLLGWAAAFVLAGVVLFIVARPLLFVPATATKRGRSLADDPTYQELEELQEKAAAETKSLQELEFDKELGIIEDGDYTALKEKSQTTLSELQQAIQMREETLADAQRERQARNAARRAAKAAGATKTAPAAATLLADAPEIAADGDDTGQPEADQPEGGHKWKMVKVDLHCSECATAFKPGDKFCTSCGAPLPLLCRRCHAELEPNDKFCANCGMTTK